MSAVALVQGASRGVGLQFCRNLLATRADTVVIATCRNPDQASELQTLQQQHSSRLKISQLDVTSEDHILDVAGKVTSSHGKLDLVINSSGMLHPSGRGETSLRDVSQEGLQTTFLTNTVGALLMAKHFGDLMKKGTGAFGKSGNGEHSSVLVNMSAKVGSITDNGLGGWYSYRLSKAALNMTTKNLSLEFGRGRKKVVCISLHPGTVDTDLSRPYHKNVPPANLFSAEHSVNLLMNIINGLTIKDTGKFMSWNGSELPF